MNPCLVCPLPKHITTFPRRTDEDISHHKLPFSHAKSPNLMRSIPDLPKGWQCHSCYVSSRCLVHVRWRASCNNLMCEAPKKNRSCSDCSGCFRPISVQSGQDGLPYLPRRTPLMQELLFLVWKPHFRNADNLLATRFLRPIHSICDFAHSPKPHKKGKVRHDYLGLDVHAKLGPDIDSEPPPNLGQTCIHTNMHI